jgi:hypothetical protein
MKTNGAAVRRITPGMTGAPALPMVMEPMYINGIKNKHRTRLSHDDLRVSFNRVRPYNRCLTSHEGKAQQTEEKS